jgi:1-acyl-sn-glycerol-3-phosphate acyltransferase
LDDWKLQPARDLGLGPIQRFRSFDRESGLIQTVLHQIWWSLVRGYLSFAHRLSIIGSSGIPTEPPFLLVANHTSHLDALVLAAPLNWRLRDRIFPIAAGDVFFETPAVAAFAAGMLNALPMWRKKCGPHALQQLRQRLLEEPCAYILFPEGGRSRDGMMTHFKPGLGMLVAGTAVPVVPCHLGGTFAALRPDTRWPKLGAPITLQVGEPLVFQGVANNRRGWEEIAQSTRMAVEELARANHGRVRGARGKGQKNRGPAAS